MLLPSEVEARAMIPALRALIARKLIEAHNLPQQKVANMLGVTQAAVSNYLREVRGAGISIDLSGDTLNLIDDIVHMLLDGADSVQLLEKFHDTVGLMKGKRVMCNVHQQMEPNLDIKRCHICDAT
jgi:hypothetical protein